MIYFKKGHNCNDIEKNTTGYTTNDMEECCIKKDIHLVDVNVSVELEFKRKMWRGLFVVAQVFQGPLS